MSAEDASSSGVFAYGSHGGSTLTSLIPSSSSQPLDPFFISGSSPSFLGSGSMVSFEDLCSRKRSERPFFCTFEGDENCDDEFDGYFNHSEKKRRLTSEQVRFLEKSFDNDNKLEPERKSQLAKDLGLQPRQVAIWFQNRRARWKTKQLEKDFDILQANFNKLKAEYDILLNEKDKLNAEVLWLSDKLQLKETSGTEIQITASEDEAPHQQILDLVCKQEDPSSATSDVVDSDSPHYVEGEPIDSTYTLEPLNSNLLHSSVYVLPKIENFEEYSDDPPSISCQFTSLVEDQGSWFWSY